MMQNAAGVLRWRYFLQEKRREGAHSMLEEPISVIKGIGVARQG